MSTNPPVLYVVGPTAVGKSALAMHLAFAFDGEIVNADSRQVYRFMDIGTAKPSTNDRTNVPHHLIDILNPDQEFSLAKYLDLAHEAVQDIQRRSMLPSVAGGTGQYIWALLEGWQVPHVPPNLQLRRQLEDLVQREGAATLHKQLVNLDPESAARIDPRNVRRIIRALEIYQATGSPPSALRSKTPPHQRPLIIGLTMARDALYRRIDRRVDEMLEMGLLDEVDGLLSSGYESDLPSMSGMGYKELALHLRGEITLEEATQRIKYETHRFARRQYPWFRLSDERIHWLEAGAEVNILAEALVKEFIRAGSGCDKIVSTRQDEGQ